jgi:hypothetical protein
MSLSELQSMLSDVKRGGTLTGGTKVKKSGVAVRTRNKTSRMEGPNAAAHGLDGVLYHSANKSLYGGDFQGAGFETGAGHTGGMEGGMVIGGFLPVIAGLASAFAPMLIGSVAKALRGSGSNGLYSRQEVDSVVGGAVQDLQPVFTRVFERLAKRGRGAGACKCPRGAMCKCAGGMKRGKGGMMRGIGEVVHTGGPSAMGKHLGASRGGALTGGDFQGAGFETGAGGAYAKGGKKPKSAARSASAKARAKTNPWLQHVAEVRKDHPGVPYKKILQIAKQSY